MQKLEYFINSLETLPRQVKENVFFIINEDASAQVPILPSSTVPICIPFPRQPA